MSDPVDPKPPRPPTRLGVHAAAAEMEDARPDVDPRIERAAAGDRQAAESLLRDLLPRIRNLVRYLVRGDDQVDDFTQNVMIEVLKSLPGYRGEGSIQGWTDRICVRVTLSQAKRTRAERRKREAAAPELAVVTTHGSRAAAPDDFLARRRVAAMLDALPAEQREALVLHHVLGMSVPEVADSLGVPFDTAKSRLRLGLRKLRDTGGDSTASPAAVGEERGHD